MSTFSERLARATVSLGATVLLALVVWFVVQFALTTAGATSVVANVASSGAAISVALSLSDVYLPIGGGPTTDRLSERPPVENALDALLAGVLASIVGYGVGISGFTDLLGIAAATAVGYGSFLVRHREDYVTRER